LKSLTVTEDKWRHAKQVLTDGRRDNLKTQQNFNNEVSPTDQVANVHSPLHFSHCQRVHAEVTEWNSAKFFRK